MSSEPGSSTTFQSLGLSKPLLEAVEQLKYSTPTDIQAQVIPHALAGHDIIGVASTGSGKTAAFALPILQKLWEDPQDYFACVLAPTRELAFQISAQFEALGAGMGIRCIVIVGGLEDRVKQAIALAKRPHIIVATPGRLNDHLKSTKGFSLRKIQFLVLDEADRLLDLDFNDELNEILKAVPKERTTYLFSATMSTKVSKLQRASLSNPVRVEVSSKFSTVSTLLQYYLLCPLKSKDVYLVHMLNEMAQNTMIIFTRTVHDARRLTILLRTLGFGAIPLHGQLSQSERLGALTKFKAGTRSILVATDVASRGLDIPSVDVVINFDVPVHSKDYIHRVGRTARAGRAGKALLMVTQYDVEFMVRLEEVLARKLELWPIGKDEVMTLVQRVDEAARLTVHELREQGHGMTKRKRGASDRSRDDKDRDDDVVEAGIPVVNHQKRRR